MWRLHGTVQDIVRDVDTSHCCFVGQGAFSPARVPRDTSSVFYVKSGRYRDSDTGIQMYRNNRHSGVVTENGACPWKKSRELQQEMWKIATRIKMTAAFRCRGHTAAAIPSVPCGILSSFKDGMLCRDLAFFLRLIIISLQGKICHKCSKINVNAPPVFRTEIVGRIQWLWSHMFRPGFVKTVVLPSGVEKCV